VLVSGPTELPNFLFLLAVIADSEQLDSVYSRIYFDSQSLLPLVFARFQFEFCNHPVIKNEVKQRIPDF